MTRPGTRKVGELRASRANTERTLAPGIHAATIELASKGAFRVRTTTGERVKASLGAGVDPSLVEECLKERRTVLVAPHPKGAIIVGALQVSASARREKLRLEARDIELCAGSRIVLRVGKSLVVIDEQGGIQMVGDGMTVKMAKAVRVRSANVELP